MGVDPTSQPQPYQLLIVDDEPHTLKLVKKMLARTQYEIMTCESAEEAIRMLNAKHFDCLITDAMMPITTGFELVQSIRKEDTEYNTIPVLMLTCKRDRQDVKKAVEAGVTDYVLKPIDEHLLLEKVELCLKETRRQK